jgi:hypothetical protein
MPAPWMGAFLLHFDLSKDIETPVISSTQAGGFCMGNGLALIGGIVIGLIAVIVFCLMIIAAPFYLVGLGVDSAIQQVSGPSPAEQAVATATAQVEDNQVLYKADLIAVAQANKLGQNYNTGNTGYVYLGPKDKLTIKDITVGDAGKYYVVIGVEQDAYFSGYTPDYVISVNGTEVQTVTGANGGYSSGGGAIFPAQFHKGTNTITISVRNYEDHCLGYHDANDDPVDNCLSDGIELVLVETQPVEPYP